jgi:xylan 1,4-beta-xylosidase
MLAAEALDTRGEIELKLAIDEGEAAVAWRPAAGGAWRELANDVDVRHMASVRAGLFTGVVVGPYAVSGNP